MEIYRVNYVQLYSRFVFHSIVCSRFLRLLCREVAFIIFHSHRSNSLYRGNYISQKLHDELTVFSPTSNLEGYLAHLFCTVQKTLFVRCFLFFRIVNSCSSKVFFVKSTCITRVVSRAFRMLAFSNSSKISGDISWTFWA